MPGPLHLAFPPNGLYRILVKSIVDLMMTRESPLDSSVASLVRGHSVGWAFIYSKCLVSWGKMLCYGIFFMKHAGPT